MILENEADTQAFGYAIAAALKAGDAIALTGPLGVGKTALARGILQSLGHVGEVPSPSFAIVQPYDDTRPPVWHVDLFRIENPEEIHELGLDAADEGVLIIGSGFGGPLRSLDGFRIREGRVESKFHIYPHAAVQRIPRHGKA